MTAVRRTWPVDFPTKQVATTLAILAAALSCLGVSVGSANPPDPPNATNPSAKVASPDDILRAFQRSAAHPNVVPPASASQNATTNTSAHVIPEGVVRSAAKGRLQSDGQWFKYDWGVADLAPTRILPNATLESMFRTYRTTPEIEFIVSGEFTVFSGENFFFPVVAMRSPDPVSAGPVPESGSSMGANDAAASVRANEDVERVLELLGSLRPHQVMLQRDQGEGSETIAATPRVEGAPISNRPGRLVKSAHWWTLVFEADQPSHPEPPLKVLPNQILEAMLLSVDRFGHEMVFSVSGTLSLFQGEAFVLIRAAQRQPDLGNLQK